MNWKNIVIESVENFFKEMEKNLGKRGMDRIVGKNPKGDETSRIDEIAQKAYEAVLPEVTVISEESLSKRDSDCIVILDPLCGSVFAERGSRYFATGITVCDKEMLPLCEAIGLFETRDIYFAGSRGAFRNGKRIRVSDTKAISDSIINFESHKPVERLGIMKTRLFSEAPRMFCSGSVKNSLAWLAGGYIDSYVCPANAFPSTELIGAFIVEKAGGIASDANGRKLRVYPDLVHRSSLVCSATKELHREILSNL